MKTEITEIKKAIKQLEKLQTMEGEKLDLYVDWGKVQDLVLSLKDSLISYGCEDNQ